MNVSRRVAVVGAVAASSVVMLAGPALAHVSVQPEGSAAKGGYAVVNFKVPNERDDAQTVKLEVNFPADHPLASVQPQALPGWTVEVTKSKLDKPLTVHGKQINEAVTKVTWSGGKIESGYFQKFPLSIGALPTDTDKLVFKAVQTYSNGETVRWIEEQKQGAEEPANPAPVLALSAASADHHGGAAPASDDKKDDDMAGHDDKKTEAASDSKDTDNTARALGVVGIVVGVAGVAFGVLAGRRRAA
ncbi:YcnI family copper-binding membrane protein [Streptomyces melanogenes]|uniref:YcnI family copper-binding membrane protein n=1 Tax=Streptomyces melanogenes TaxID=67326 RepID=UPI00167E8AE6|nr:YcnI family protein [Streptomyces melanogenes]GGP69410.1 membrane protein [Streptomyces melanogenes]